MRVGCSIQEASLGFLFEPGCGNGFRPSGLAGEGGRRKFVSAQRTFSADAVLRLPNCGRIRNSTRCDIRPFSLPRYLRCRNARTGVRVGGPRQTESQRSDISARMVFASVWADPCHRARPTYMPSRWAFSVDCGRNWGSEAPLYQARHRQ